MTEEFDTDWEIAARGTTAALDKCRQVRLTDDEIGRLWFKCALSGVTETQARFLIRAAEQALREKMVPWRPAE